MSHVQRRQFLIIAGLLLAAPFAAQAQRPERMTRIGILVAGSLEQRGHLDQALTEGLREQGYVEGKNLVIERRYADGISSQLPKFASALIDMKLDAIVTTCSPSTRAAKEATSSTPIVMAAVSDPVAQNLIASLANPGQNITGLSSQADELLPKRLEFLAGVVPAQTLIAVLANSRNAIHPPMWQKMQNAAQKLKLRLVLVEADGAAGLPAAFDAVVGAHAGALFVLPDDPMSFNARARIVAFAARNRMPDFYWASEFVEAGGLLSYGENLRNSYVNAASYVDKVVKGAKPATLPVAQPTRFELVVNQKAAKSLGLKISPSILLRADRVIE